MADRFEDLKTFLRTLTDDREQTNDARHIDTANPSSSSLKNMIIMLVISSAPSSMAATNNDYDHTVDCGGFALTAPKEICTMP
jgi:hypothetical protein